MRVGPAKLPGNPNKKRIISQDDDSLSLFGPSDVEEEFSFFFKLGFTPCKAEQPL